MDAVQAYAMMFLVVAVLCSLIGVVQLHRRVCELERRDRPLSLDQYQALRKDRSGRL